MTNTYLHAKREFEVLNKTWTKDKNPDERPIILDFEDEILALAEKFGLSGQSGGAVRHLLHLCLVAK